MKKLALLVAVLALAGVAFGADLVAERTVPASSYEHGVGGKDSTMELKWDNGATSWIIAYYTGAGLWCGNDFNVSTIKTYSGIKSLAIYGYITWPNNAWDGWRMGIWGFSGGVPGSMLWPTGGSGSFVKASGSSGWKYFDVNWVLPGVKSFVAAFEQFYNYPSCDGYVIDGNPTFMGHSWQYYSGEWAPWESSNIAPYRNLCIRAVVDNEQNPGISPSSIGRVKALYY